MQTRSVGTIAASTTCCLRTTAALCSTWYSLLLPCCIVCHTNKIEATKSAGPRSDLQQCSRIMMHPSGYPDARRQRCSHVPIPLQCVPRSVWRSIWSLSRSCYVLACCVLSFALCGLKISHHDHLVRQIILHRETAPD